MTEETPAQPLAAPTPRTMRTPKINFDALFQQFAEWRTRAETADIRTRAEVRLDDAEKTRESINAEIVDVREELARLERLRQQIEALDMRLKANEADLNIELAAINAEIASLRDSGVNPTRTPASEKKAAQ